MNAPTGASMVFTLTGNGPLRALITKVSVAQAFSIGGTAHPYHDFQGLWDTGATGTVITQKIVDACGLVPVGMTKSYHAQGESMVNEYLVNVHLPNGVSVPSLRVTWGKLSGIDLLIGMDIINLGDFSISNKEGKTCLSYRIPSTHHQDFLKGVPIAKKHVQGPNEKCACKSGKKYKKCCGKEI